MAWFSRNNQPSVDKEQLLAQQRQVDETIQALENAKRPPYIRRRMAKQRQGSLPWTSTLSISEWLLSAKHKFRPLGMIITGSLLGCKDLK